MRLRMFVVLILALFACHSGALAQNKNVPTLGILALGSTDPSVFVKELKTKLSELGYVDGKNIRLEFRSAEGQSSRLATLASDLVAMKVAALVTYQTPAALAAKAATSEIPIVMAGAADPVGNGLIKSLAHPGGNVTGVTGATSELATKNLELIREAAPSARRIALLANEPDPFHKILAANTQKAAAQLGLEVEIILAKAGDDFDKHFATMKSAGIDGVLVQPSLPLREVAAGAAKSGLPATCPLQGYARAGGLMSYAADPSIVNEQTAAIVDKVLRGRKPADLPVEIANKFVLIVNAKAANMLGLKLSPMLLARADEVIE